MEQGWLRGGGGKQIKLRQTVSRERLFDSIKSRVKGRGRERSKTTFQEAQWAEQCLPFFIIIIINNICFTRMTR